MSARDDYPNLASIAAAKLTARPAVVYSWTRDQIIEALDEIDVLRGDYSPPAFEDDPVAMALGFTPTKPGVLLPGTPEHCHRCALDEIDRLRAENRQFHSIADARQGDA